MKCQRCKEREANVQIIQQEAGKKPQTFMLCDICAREMGISIPTMPLGVKMTNPFAVMGNAFQTTFGLGNEELNRRRILRCPKCQLSFDQFRKEGFLGCPTCYSTFGSQMDPVFCRTQMGKKHIGRRLGEPTDPDKQTDLSEPDRCTLKDQLDSIDARDEFLPDSMRMQGESALENRHIEVGDHTESEQTGDRKKNDSIDNIEKRQVERQLERMKKALGKAIEIEDYLNAAKIRDQISNLENKGEKQ